MRIGIVAYWFNRGQGVVARHLRSALDELGHETFVLARPTRKTNIRPDWIDREGVWAQERITAASDYLIPREEYERWAAANAIEAMMFDQNYQFEEIEQLRRSGVRTIGRFVWEHFADEHVEPAGAAFETIYSMTACERERYLGMGITSPRVRWGCHPDLLAFAADEVTPGHEAEPAGDRGIPAAGQSRLTGRPSGSLAEEMPRINLFFPGGFMSKRKPLAETIEAFRMAEGDELRLIIKAQVERQVKKVKRMAKGNSRLGRRDPRIEIRTEDMPTEQYLRLLASADACLAPSRWEGLGLHLYEATAFGVPIVTNDNPPMNEIVSDGVNGLLVPGIPDGRARSGIGAFRPDVAALTAAIERLRDPGLRAQLAAGARARREELSWSRTVADLQALLGGPGSMVVPQ